MINRYGGFRTRKLFSVWEDRKTASRPTAPEPAQITNFDYTTAQGIWNLRSTTSFPKSIQTISQVDRRISNTDSSAYTFTKVNIGESFANRYVVVVSSFISASSIVVSGVTIDGIAATVAVARPGTTVGSAIHYLNVPNSISEASIVVTLSGTGQDCIIDVFAINLESSIQHSANSNGLTGTPVSISANITPSATVNRGIIIASARRGSSLPGFISVNSENLTDSNAVTQSSGNLASNNAYLTSYGDINQITPGLSTYSITAGGGVNSGTMTLVAALFYI
jgi:hypothetical protein